MSVVHKLKKQIQDADARKTAKEIAEKNAKQRARFTKTGSAEEYAQIGDMDFYLNSDYGWSQMQYAYSWPAGTNPTQEQVKEEFQKSLVDYQRQFSDYIAKSQSWLDKADNIEEQSSMLTKTMHRHMLISCVQPLQFGLSPSTVIQCIGMYAGMSLVDRNFRQSVKEIVGKNAAPMIDNLADTVSQNGFVNKFTNGPAMAQRVHQWTDKMRAEANYGRMPFTPESAAMADISLHKMAYNAMRQPGADIDDIKQKYTECHEKLFSMAEHDGVSSTDICKNVRVIIGKMQMRESQQIDFADKQHMDIFSKTGMSKTGRIFEEMTYTDVVRDDFHKESVIMYDADGNPYTEEKKVWIGEYYTESPDGGKEPYEGDFSPRVPMSDDECDIRLSQSLDYIAESSIDGKTYFNKLMAFCYGVHGDFKDAGGLSMDSGAIFDEYRNSLSPDDKAEYDAFVSNPNTSNADFYEYMQMQSPETMKKFEAGFVMQHAFDSYKVTMDAMDDGFDRFDYMANCQSKIAFAAEETLKQHPDWIDDFKAAGKEYGVVNDDMFRTAEQKAQRSASQYGQPQSEPVSQQEQSVNNGRRLPFESPIFADDMSAKGYGAKAEAHFGDVVAADFDENYDIYKYAEKDAKPNLDIEVEDEYLNDSVGDFGA